MCTPSADELVTLREFLACKDPQDSTKTHTFSYLIDEEDHKVAEEILETSVSSPWEMIRSLTQEDSAGDDPAQRRINQGCQGNGWQHTQLKEIAPSAVFVPKVLGGGGGKATASSNGTVPVLTRPGALMKPPFQLPVESSSRATAVDPESIRQLTALAKSQLEATTTATKPTSASRQVILGNARQQPSLQQHLIVERKVPRSRKGGPSVVSSADRASTKFPILGDTPSDGSAHRDGVSSVESSSQVGIKLLKVFENDEFITFKKVYPASMGGTPLASVGAQPNSTFTQHSSDTESRGQSESRRSSHQREARMDPPERFEEEGRTDVISEETKVSSSGARQVLIVVSSKKHSHR
jgi:hypothetical protein